MNQSMATLPPSSPPMSSQVIKAEPTPSQPTSSQVSQHPMFREMSQSQPAQHQPLISQTPQRQPMSSQPPSSQPPLSQPSFSQPTSSQPPSSQPPASQGTPGQPKQRWFPPWYRRPDETYYDESLWGQSNIPIGSRILKGESTKKYHLQYYELNGLKFDTEHFTLRGGEPGTKMWYKVYGGPLGFEKYLREAHEVYQAKTRRTRPKPAEAKKRADALNESKWRKSALTARKKIMKTDALKKYHLQDYDLVGLDVEYKKFNIPGRRTQGTKHMYKEKEVELVAWRKHGGPDGFAAHMRNRR
ncbi:hypothetical protein BKA70DRAFT_1276690 [Coprinopsis sp. MPI-PUGE-AT-0042]|nr:hypothetical protein BKA70DRAFT_1276690 [Coprinopsis sp. MPI-PUGE-AT-0042]